MPGVHRFRRVSAGAIRLLGAFSNPETGTRLKQLNKFHRRLLRECADSPPPPSSSPPPRIGAVAKAVVRSLSRSDEPMHTIAILRAVERDLGQPVSYRTVKAFLSEGARKSTPRFERVAHGEYRLMR